MIEPDFLNVPQLAKLWGQEPQQIIAHGLALRLPILFLFDGVAIAQYERMQSQEAEFLERRELEQKTESVRGCEDRIRRNAVGPTDKFRRMNSDDVIELRREINVSKGRINQLNELIDQREQKRLESRYTGTMRALPQTLLEIWQDGETAFPFWAMHPLSEIHVTEDEGRQYWDGMIMHLEPGVPGKWKQRLGLDDLLIPMQIIKALEAKKKIEVEDEVESEPPLKGRRQEEAVIVALQELGYDPVKLPPHTPKGGAKAEVKKQLLARRGLFTESAFRKTWERLSGSGDVAYEKK